MKTWLKASLFTLVVFVGSLGFAGFMLSMTTPPPTDTVVAKPVVQDKPLLILINELRTKQGIAPLVTSPELHLSAQEKADDMATRHYFDHKSPDGIRGVDIIPRFLPAAIRGSENLTVCVDNDDNAGAFKAWSNSPAHLQGMIDTRVTLYGEGKAWDDEKQCMVYVNHFAAQ